MRDIEYRPGAGRRLDHDQEPTVAREEDGAAASEDEESDVEFEFPSVSRDSSSAAGCGGGAAAADELFAGGRIRAFYPVFGRVLDEASASPSAPAPSHSPSRSPLGRLFKLEQARASSVASTSSSSSSASSASTADAGLDSASPDTYCLWTPGSSPASSPSRRPPTRKSGSTGSSVPRWRRIGELVVGRSRSDGKDRFLFLSGSAPSSPARDTTKAAKQAPPKGGGAKAGSGTGTELDTVAAGRRMSYGGGGGGAKASPGGRRTFLPYRQDLMGLFTSVHGLSRSANPF